MNKNSIEEYLAKRTYFGLKGLDRKLEKYIDFDNGYFVELGANDGVNQSNTLYFERSRGWRGLLVEAIEKNYRKCLLTRSGENAIYCAACVSFSYNQSKVRLKYSNLMTAPVDLESDIPDPAEHARSGAMYLRKEDGLFDAEADARTLNSLLEDAGAPYNIDLLSLDVEGAEIEVLKGIDHKKYRFGKILVETRSITSMQVYLENNEYQLINQLSHHDYLFTDTSSA